MNFLRSITIFINEFFLFYMVIYGVILLSIMMVGAYLFHKLKRKKKYKNEITRDYYLPVSIIVPAYNDEENIISRMDNLLNLNYKLYEIIVVDDGSNDQTLKTLIDKYKLKKVEKVTKNDLKTKKVKEYYEGLKKVKITVVSKNFGGRSDTLNAGINTCHYPYFLIADHMVAKNALTELIKPVMEDLSIIMTEGSLRFSKEINMKNGEFIEDATYRFFSETQNLETGREDLVKGMFDNWDGNALHFESFMLLKKKTVIQVGGYKSKVKNENADLLLRFREYTVSNKIPYKVKFVPEAICYQKIDATLNEYQKDRSFKKYSILESLRLHKNMIMKTKYGFLFTVSFIYQLLKYILFPIIETIGLIFIFVSYGLQIMDITSLIFYLLTYLLFCMTSSVMIFFHPFYKNVDQIDCKEFLYIFFYTILENIGLRQWINLSQLFYLEKSTKKG